MSGFDPGLQPHFGVGAAKTLLSKATRGSRIMVDRIAGRLISDWQIVSHTSRRENSFGAYLGRWENEVFAESAIAGLYEKPSYTRRMRLSSEVKPGVAFSCRIPPC